MKDKRYSFTLFLFASVCLSLSAFGQNDTNKLSTEADIKADLATVPCKKNSERLEAVRTLFQRMGAADSEISVDTYKDLKNLVVKKKGSTDETVIIGAHYDKVSDGCGAIDNWSGIVIIANIFKSIRNADTKKTYVFVAFDKEEVGLLGSRAMAKAIPKEKRLGYCSMINFDSFGFGFVYPQVLENASSTKMTAFAKELATETKTPFASASLQGAADADSTSFKANNIPAVTLHGLSNRWQEYLHSSRDKLENVNPSSVFVGYVFGLKYLMKIDSVDCQIFRSK